MIERELTALADRVAPPTRPDLPDRVLARIDGLAPRSDRGPKRVRALVAAGLAALVAASFLSPQVRAAAADLLGVAGIEFSSDTPDAPPEPRAPLPDSQEIFDRVVAGKAWPAFGYIAAEADLKRGL